MYNNRYMRQRNNKQQQNFSMEDLFKNKNLELVAAALLLSGRLKVDSVELFRSAPTVNVTLIGKYLTANNNKTNALVDFLDEHGDMTIDDIFDAFQTKMQQGGSDK